MSVKPLGKKMLLGVERFSVGPTMALCLAIGVTLFSTELCALQESDKVAEIATLTNDVTKIAKNGCYITGCASALIGSVWAVAQQSLKVFGVAAGVTLLAFKAPTFFTSALLI